MASERGESGDEVDLTTQLEQSLLELDLVIDHEVELVEQLVVKPVRETNDSSVHIEGNPGDFEQDLGIPMVCQLPNEEVEQLDHVVFVSVREGNRQRIPLHKFFDQ